MDTRSDLTLGFVRSSIKEASDANAAAAISWFPSAVIDVISKLLIFLKMYEPRRQDHRNDSSWKVIAGSSVFAFEASIIFLP